MKLLIDNLDGLGAQDYTTFVRFRITASTQRKNGRHRRRKLRSRHAVLTATTMASYFLPRWEQILMRSRRMRPRFLQLTFNCGVSIG
jgi:hypothetical protein